MTEKLLKTRLYRRYEAITYVPMHKMDMLARGYNQSKILAKKVSKDTLLKFIEPVEKIKENKNKLKLQV